MGQSHVQGIPYVLSSPKSVPPGRKMNECLKSPAVDYRWYIWLNS